LPFSNAANLIDGLNVVATNHALLPVIHRIPKLATRLAGVSDADVLASVARVAPGIAQSVDHPVKEVEFEAFAEAAEELGSDQPDGDFFARALPKPTWDAPWMSPIKRVVLVHRLREVVAKVGFTRFELLGADINGELPDELTLNVKAAPLARDADWVPAVENRGEGFSSCSMRLACRTGCIAPLSKPARRCWRADSPLVKALIQPVRVSFPVCPITYYTPAHIC